MVGFYLVLAIICGFCTAFQSPTNATLSRHIGNLQATCVSFGGGTVCLAVLMFIIGTGDLGNIVYAQWWQLLGGIYGVAIVLAITYGIPRLGAALTTTILMLGQIATGAVLDTFGLMNLPRVPLENARIIGCLVVLAGIIIVYIGKRKQEAGRTYGKGTAVVAVCLVLAGMGGAVQAPTNNALSAYIGTIEASFVSFFGGFIIILIIALIATKGHLFKNRKSGIEWWMLTGGAYGAAVVFINLVAVPYLGSAALLIATMLGQLTGGMLIDSFGLLRTNKIKANSWRWAGMAIIAAGVVIIAVSKL